MSLCCFSLASRVISRPVCQCCFLLNVFLGFFGAFCDISNKIAIPKCLLGYRDGRATRAAQNRSTFSDSASTMFQWDSSSFKTEIIPFWEQIMVRIQLNPLWEQNLSFKTQVFFDAQLFSSILGANTFCDDLRAFKRKLFCSSDNLKVKQTSLVQGVKPVFKRELLRRKMRLRLLILIFCAIS